MDYPKPAAMRQPRHLGFSIAAALTAVGLTLKVETPFWPTALGPAPALGAVVVILGVVLAPFLIRRRT